MSEKRQEGSRPSTSSAEGSLARTSPARERAQALLGAARACGTSSLVSRALYAPAGSLSRTSPAEPGDGLTRWCLAWTSSGMKLYRSRCQREMSALLTSENGSSSLPALQTPSVEDAGRQGSAEAWRQWKEEGRTTGARLRNQVQSMMLPTPSASAADRGGRGELVHAIKAGDPRNRRGMLPTPASRDYKGPSQHRDPKHGKALPNALGQQAVCLNPRFVEWMMGIPEEFSRPSATPGSGPSGTPSCPSALKSSDT